MIRDARSHSSSMASSRLRNGSGTAACRFMSWTESWMVESGLFSSCAMPDSRVPSALSLSACMSCACVSWSRSRFSCSSA